MDKRVIYVHQGMEGDLLCEDVAPPARHLHGAVRIGSRAEALLLLPLHTKKDVIDNVQHSLKGRAASSSSSSYFFFFSAPHPPPLAAALHISHSLKHMTCTDPTAGSAHKLLFLPVSVLTAPSVLPYAFIVGVL